MPANTAPIFSLSGVVGQVGVSAANTKSNGTGTIGTDIFLLFTAGANGSFVDRVRWTPTATAASTATGATVARIFISTKTSGATTGSTDTFLFQEIALPAVTADATAAAPNFYEIPLGFVLPNGYTILVTNHAAPNANTQWQAQLFGGNY